MENQTFQEQEFSPLGRRRVDLSIQEQDLVLSTVPEGARIASAAYFDNYDLPCPIRIEIVLPDGENTAAVLRRARTGDVETEAQGRHTVTAE